MKTTGALKRIGSTVHASFTRDGDAGRVNKRARLCTGLAVTIALLTACGGSGGEPVAADAVDEKAVVETTSPTTTPPTDPAAAGRVATEPSATDPPPTEPPAAEPPTTEPVSDLPEWASGEPATVEADTGPLELPMELVRFRESSRSFYIAAKGSTWFATVSSVRHNSCAQRSLIDSAPSDEFAVEPMAAQDQLAVIIPAFEEAGYDNTRASEVSDPAAAGETIEPTAPVAAVPGTPITNEAANITLSVPTDWTETEESVEDGREQLVASSDIDTFYGLATPGLLMLRSEGSFGDRGFVGRVLEFRVV